MINNFQVLIFFTFIALFPVVVKGQAKKHFTLLDPSHTNIYFSNDLSDTKEDNIMFYSNFYGGAGVGIGDINNDGLQDIYFAGNQVGDKLYLNKGNLVFEDITEKAGILDNGGWSSGIIIGDINQDGFQDIYVTRELYDYKEDLRRNNLYLNNGNETFTECAEKYGLDDSERTRHATFIDYDKDGDLDIFLLNQPPNPGDFSAFKNTELLQPKYSPRLMENRGEIFVDVTQEAGLLKAGFPNSVTAADFNNDGWTDLFIANDFYARDFIYINQGDGTFTDKAYEMTNHISFSSMGIDAGDINNDGWLDVMVLDMVAEDNFRRKSNMSGMPKDQFMKVGKEDGHYQYMYNMLFLNNGAGYFREIAQFADVDATDWSWSVLFADLDNDGWQDIHITNGLMRDIRNNDAARIYPKYLDGKVQEYLAENPDAGEVSLWDIVDIEEAMNISPSVKIPNYTYKNNRDLTFQNVSESWGLDQLSFSNGSAYADLDNDGDLDLVVNNINDAAFVYKNNAESISGTNYFRVVPVADQPGVTALNSKVWIENDDKKQYFEITSVRGMYSTSEHIAHFGLGSASKVQKVTVQWPDEKVNILKNQKANQVIEVKYSDAKSLNIKEETDPKPLFTEVSEQLGLVVKHNENPFDDFEKQLMLPHRLSDQGPCMATGDVNGDGLDDVFFGGSAGTVGRLFNQKSDGSFGVIPFTELSESKKCEDVDALFFDLDNDNDLDLYIVSGGNEYRAGSDEYQDRLYVNDGIGNFTKVDDKMPALKSSGSRIIPADYDGDGDMDLFVAGRHTPWKYPAPTSSYLLRNDRGILTDVTEEIASDLVDIGMVNDAVWVDYDQDGMLDLALAGEWMPFTVLKNTDNKFVNMTDGLGLANSNGWWFSIDTADMDGDGDPDFILGNLGLNFEYKASEENPFYSYYYDFDNNGTEDLVLAYEQEGHYYPVRELNRSIQQVPLLAGKVKSYTEFAGQDVYEIYGQENLNNAQQNEAKTFASMYVENLGGGKFALHELPKEAQLLPINDLIIEDINQDGHLDIIAAGNLFGMEVETVRPDAGEGLILMGNGKGNFSPLPSAKSGFFVPFDVKRIKSFEYQGMRILIVGCNNDFFRFFKPSNDKASNLDN